MKILERALKILDRGVKFHRASLGVHGALQNSQDASVFRDFARGKFSEILERARKSLEIFFAQKNFFRRESWGIGVLDHEEQFYHKKRRMIRVYKKCLRVS